MTKTVKRSPYIVNSGTGVVTEDKKETNDEKKYYRVMPVDSCEKLYFDSKDQYIIWRQKQMKTDPYKLLGIHVLPGYDISQKMI